MRRACWASRTFYFLAFGKVRSAPTYNFEPVMNTMKELTPAEQARYLRQPDGDLGLSVAEFLNTNNRDGNTRTVTLLDLQAGYRVLEIGFGNGRTVPDVVGRAANIRYVGIDISQTMVDEASRFNAGLVSQEIAGFHLGSAEHLPFADASFERVFSTGVIHFWEPTAKPLAEVRRVLTSGGLMIMGCLAFKDPPQFARSEFGFHLRDASEWEGLCRAAGFADVNVATLESDGIGPDGTPLKRNTIQIFAGT
jgi:SAM-dependent methyltransferase